MMVANALHRTLRRPLLLAYCLVLLAAGPGVGAENHEAYHLDRQRAPEENLLSLIFGSPPPMATERGILLIDAFADSNGNGRRDPGETNLHGQVSCALDGIDYQVPAFIPGLKYEGSYQLACSSSGYRLDLKSPDLFIARRGQILRVDIPCRPRAGLQSSTASEASAPRQ